MGSSLLNGTPIIRLGKEMTWPSTLVISGAEVVEADKMITIGKAPDPENNISPLKSWKQMLGHCKQTCCKMHGRRTKHLRNGPQLTMQSFPTKRI